MLEIESSAKLKNAALLRISTVVEMMWKWSWRVRPLLVLGFGL
jgi:hypothetical protein